MLSTKFRFYHTSSRSPAGRQFRSGLHPGFRNICLLIIRHNLDIPVAAHACACRNQFTYNYVLLKSHRSLLPLMAASVSTLVVSWKEAADRKDSVARDALVIPRSTRLLGRHASSCYDTLVFPVEFKMSTRLPGRGSVSPASSTLTLRSI